MEGDINPQYLTTQTGCKTDISPLHGESLKTQQY